MDTTPEHPKTQSRLKLTLRPSSESIVRSGHPWIYSDSIRSQNRDGEAGELAVIYDRKNQFLAMGFFDPTSPLRVRSLHVGDAEMNGRRQLGMSRRSSGSTGSKPRYARAGWIRRAVND